MKRPRIRASYRWIAGCVIAAFLGFQAIAVEHHHNDGKFHADCVVCQAIAHHALAATPPSAAPAVTMPFLLLILLLQWQPLFRFSKEEFTPYFGRAPPAPVA